MSDKVNHPEHYTAGGVECIEAITAAVKDLEGEEAFLTGQVIKYMWRWKRKHKENPAEDLRKAEWYLHRLIEKTEAKNQEENI